MKSRFRAFSLSTTPKVVVDHVTIDALSEEKDIIMINLVYASSGLPEDRVLFAFGLDGCEMAVKGVYGSRLHDVEQGTDDIFWKLVDVLEAFDGPTEQADGTIDIFALNVLDLKFLDAIA